MTSDVPIWLLMLLLLTTSFGGSVGTGVLALVQRRRAVDRELALDSHFQRQDKETREYFSREIAQRDRQICELQVVVAQLSTLISEMNPKAALMFAAHDGSMITVGGDAVGKTKQTGPLSPDK